MSSRSRQWAIEEHTDLLSSRYPPSTFWHSSAGAAAMAGLSDRCPRWLVAPSVETTATAGSSGHDVEERQQEDSDPEDVPAVPAGSRTTW